MAALNPVANALKEAAKKLPSTRKPLDDRRPQEESDLDRNTTCKRAKMATKTPPRAVRTSFWVHVGCKYGVPNAT